MKEINYKDMKFNPFNLIGGEWMLVTAGNEQTGCNTMTASWGHLGCLWGHNDPTAVIYLRPSRYTKNSAPWRAAERAISRPMPPDAPVSISVLPSSSREGENLNSHGGIM